MSILKGTIGTKIDLSQKEELFHECQKYGFESVSELLLKLIEHRDIIYSTIHEAEMAQNTNDSSVNADDFLNPHSHSFSNQTQVSGLQELTGVNALVNEPVNPSVNGVNAVNDEKRDMQQLMRFIKIQEHELNNLKKEYEELRLFTDFLQGFEGYLTSVFEHAADLANEVHFFPRDFTAEYFLEVLTQTMQDEGISDS